MTTIDQYAVFGHPIKHSKSPRIHQIFASQTGQILSYTAEDVPAELFNQSVTHFFAGNGKGLNCTVPLKELAFQRADQLTERARFAKAVNTLAQQEDGSILGDNTDGIGLVTDLTVNHKITLKDRRILILGAGGATRGIISPLIDQAPSQLLIANRTISKALVLAEEFNGLTENIRGCGFSDLEDRQFDIILNATSASLSNQLPPLPDGLLAEQGICYDLAYGNDPTAFVRWGLENGASKSLDGVGMLVEQAAEAFYLWRNIRPETAPVIQLLNSERGQ